MSITEQELQQACQKVTSDMVFGQGGWSQKLLEVINGLQAPELADLPVAYKRAAFLNTLVKLLDGLGSIKQKQGKTLKNLSNPYYLTMGAIKLCVEDYQNRWVQHTQDLETHLTFGYADIKQNISKTISTKVAEMFNNNSGSFLNQVIVPGVTMIGSKRLNQIQDRDMAENYCANLLQVSGLFDVYDSTVEGFDSVADTIENTFKTMVMRIQDIYYALYQPRGLGDTVYSEPQVRKIRHCIEKFEKHICRGKNNRETVAFKHIRTKGVGVLLLNAWYLEVNRDEEVVIRVMENPSHMPALINASITNNMLWHLDELVDDRRELIAWNHTLRMAA